MKHAVAMGVAAAASVVAEVAVAAPGAVVAGVAAIPPAACLQHSS